MVKNMRPLNHLNRAQRQRLLCLLVTARALVASEQLRGRQEATKYSLAMSGSAAPADEPVPDQPTADRSTDQHGMQGTEHNEIHHSDGRLEHPHVRHDERDTPFRWVFVIAIASCCILALVYFLDFGLFRGEGSVLARQRASDFPLAAHPSDEPPAAPRLEQIDRLQAGEAAKIEGRELAKERALNSYGATTEKDFVHIPIAQAMQLLAGHLPVRKPPRDAHGKDNGLLDAGEAHSGRILRRESP